MRKLLLAGVSAAALVAGAPVYAADMAFKAPVAEPVSPWSVDVGMRYWYSSGKHQFDLFNPAGSSMVSRLTFGDLTGHAAESFWRVNHSSGIFFKGYFGAGSISNGNLHDEDFPPFLVPYSNTISAQKDGSLKYFSADVGYNFLTGPNYELGAFLGYHYWNEVLNSFGCSQVAGNQGICGSIPPVFGTIPTSINGLDNDHTWNSGRVGLGGSVNLTPQWRLSAEAAYTRSFLDEVDFHNFRPTIRPLPQDATGGNGVQAEALLSYQFTRAFSLGVGGRYWYVSASDGFTRFDQTAGGGFSQPTKFTTERYGAFAQAAYKFGEPSSRPGEAYYKAPPPPFSWTGWYVGANAGYGFGDSNTTFAAASHNASTAINVTGDTPSSLHTQNAGFLGGGQTGYDWQLGPMVVGIETDLDWANVSGTIAQTSAANAFTTSVDHNISWLGTLRGRIGKAATDSLMVYATGGLAYGGTRLNVDQRQPGINCQFNFVCSAGLATGTSVGWVAGAGIEYAVTNHVTFKGEALYVDLGSRSLTTSDTATGGLAPFIYNVKTDFNAVLGRVGLNYKF